MRHNWGIGVVPPHLMPKPVVALEKRCGTCRHFDVGKCESPDLLWSMSDDPVREEKARSIYHQRPYMLMVHSDNAECATQYGAKWEAKDG